MLHGWGLNSNVWCYIINRFGSHFRLHLFDIPGYNFSQGQESFTFLKYQKRSFKSPDTDNMTRLVNVQMYCQ
ncbi:alpha/beta fold hydrolase [Candidatus Williamhamiltonella defendens]|uniref:alpha/beta fold hydrolase n=1 Tax=Candidatus Williamhamiltonella defendens TaxID=138072 RepID=UPI00387EBB4B